MNHPLIQKHPLILTAIGILITIVGIIIILMEISTFLGIILLAISTFFELTGISLHRKKLEAEERNRKK